MGFSGKYMKREDVSHMSQLLQAMKELADKMQAYRKKGDFDRALAAKNELLSMQRKVDELLR